MPPGDLTPEDAWEALDGSLSPLLGYGTTLEAIAAIVRRRPLGMGAIQAYIRYFVLRYRIDGCLLEGKINRIMDAIKIALEENTILSGIKERIRNGVPESSNFAYHGIGGLIEIARRKNLIIDGYRMRRLNDVRKLVVIEGALDMQKQVLLAISSKKIPRIDRLLQVAFKRRIGIHALLDLIKRAAAEDDLQAQLLHRLGGARLADIAHLTVRKRMSNAPVLLASPSIPTRAEISHNVEASFDAIRDILNEASPGPTVQHAVLMWDEVARRPRWDDKTNKLLGICRECGKDTSLEFSNMEDLDVIFDELGRGCIHLASEATVGAVGLLSMESRMYSARPVLLSGSCKRESAAEHASLLQTTIDAVNSKSSLTRARIISLASDGEARHGKALVQLTFKFALSPSSPIYPLLSTLRLMDFHVGDNDVTADKDFKHVAFKRVRNALLRDKGILVFGSWLTPGIIRQRLLGAGHSITHVTSIFNPADKQDVELAYHLLCDIWSLPATLATLHNPTLAQVDTALCIFGTFCLNLVFPYLCVDLSLSEQLTHLSSAAHLALAMYSFGDAKSRFLPTALYVDIMIMIKNVFFCVAKAKVDLPDEPFYIILLGTDRLETLFGILRTMIGNNTNLDILQLALRVNSTTDAPRRLHLPTLTKDTQPIHGADHISSRAWRADLIPKDVTLATSWKRGRRAAEDAFPAVWDQLLLVDSTPGTSILAPLGTLLVKILSSAEGPFSWSHRRWRGSL
ncbi:hypothetical protein BC834DRAFT_926296 [Gloeopeniophorella convolvens]|nr:hypothetical protein BC834DRAFT_926296 [Gloeopeniophorella convolvens]